VFSNLSEFEIIMAAQTPEQLARNARFVFEGTVQKVGGTDLPGLESRTKAATVRVDDIVQGPDTLRSFQGRDVLVVPDKGEEISEGTRAVFYTNAISFGDTLALQSIGHLPVRARAARALGVASPQAALKKRDVQKRVESADMVVVGKVTDVGLPREQATRGMRRASAGGESDAPRRITEHDPQWRDAVIEVDRVQKGAGARKQVIVRFPASTDVRWYQAPKFSPGDQGTFILHRPPGAARAGGVRTRALAAAGPDVYTALDPNDVQPIEFHEELNVERPARTRKTVAGGARAAPRRKAMKKTTRSNKR